jgi:hypothetical protein
MKSRNLIRFGVLALTLVLTQRGIALADASSMNDFASAVSQQDVELDPGSPVTVLVGKPKKHNMLVVHGTVSGASSTGTIGTSVTVGTLTLEPGVISQQCSGDCSVAGTWWLDLDAAEAANPGTIFTGGPLTIQFHTTAANGNRGNKDIMAILIRRGREM